MLAEIAVRQVLQNAERQVSMLNEAEQESSGQSFRQKSTGKSAINERQFRIQELNTTTAKKSVSRTG